MKRTWRNNMRSKAAGLIFSGFTIFQLSGCNFGEVTTSVTLSGEELIITLIRSAILNPIDVLVTNAVNDAFGNGAE